MSPPPPDPRHEPAGQSDAQLLHQHAAATLRKRLTDGGVIPLLALGVFVGLLCGNYLFRHAGQFEARAYDERGLLPADAKPAPRSPVAFGRKQYQAACFTCHQATGLGLPGTYPPLAASEWVNGSEERLIRIVLHGLNGEIVVEGKPFNGAMPAFGQVPGSGYNWSDDKIAAVLTYIRQEWGNASGPVTTERVKAIREAEVARAKAWTAPELQALAK